MKKKTETKPKRGFTLIELMVAISIVAVLSTIGMVFYGSAQVAARDSRRKQDLHAIATALELYRQANSDYPQNVKLSLSFIKGSWLPALDSNYMNKIPKDPINNGDIGFQCSGADSNPQNLLYAYYPIDCKSLNPNIPSDQYYLLFTRLENKNDSDRLELHDINLCNAQPAQFLTQPTTLCPFSNYDYVLTPP